MHVFNSNTGVEKKRTYEVLTNDSSYGGTYSCVVTASSISSEESSGVKITATGL